MDIEYKNTKIIPAVFAWIFIGISYYYSVHKPYENKYLRGLILSMGMYGVYNMTNLAVLPNYSNELALRDMCWGTSLITIVTFISSYIPDNLGESI